MVDEVQVVSGRDCDGPGATLGEPAARPVQRLVHVHKRIHNGAPVVWGKVQAWHSHREVLGRHQVLHAKQSRQPTLFLFAGFITGRHEHKTAAPLAAR